MYLTLLVDNKIYSLVLGEFCYVMLSYYVFCFLFVFISSCFFSSLVEVVYLSISLFMIASC